MVGALACPCDAEGFGLPGAWPGLALLFCLLSVVALGFGPGGRIMLTLLGLREGLDSDTLATLIKVSSPTSMVLFRLALQTYVSSSSVLLMVMPCLDSISSTSILRFASKDL